MLQPEFLGEEMTAPPRTFKDIIFKTWRQNTLFAVLLELTYKCNLDCYFCYNDLGLEGKPLSTEQYLDLLDELADMQAMNLILSGGEPLAHPDFFRIGAHARERGFVVRIKTNGHALRGPLARRLRDEVDPFVVDISLHGASAETHDRQTRVTGSFDRLLNNLRELKSLGLRLKLNCTMTRWNQDEVAGMLEIADELGVNMGINPTVSPRDDGDKEPLSIATDTQAKLELFRVLSRRGANQSEGGNVEVGHPADEAAPRLDVDKNCGAGSSGVTIDPYGNVLPCVQWRRPVGNLHETSIGEIWRQSMELRRVRQITAEAKKMVDAEGGDGHLMDFCPGLADVHSGDPLSVYDSAREQVAALKAIEAEEPKRALLPVVR